MPHLRSALVIGVIAIAAGAGARIPEASTRLRMREGDPAFERPAISSIVITPESVLFCGEEYLDRARFVVAFGRRESRWARLATNRAGGCPPPEPNRYGRLPDTVSLDDGVLVVRDEPARDSAGNYLDRPAYLRLVDPRNNRRTTLARRIDPALIRRIPEGVALGWDTVSSVVSATLVNDSLVWIGLAGGFPEGDGEFGGMYRVDRRTGRYELLTNTLLDQSTITGIGATGPWLWIGTEYPAEYGPYGDHGVLRMDQRTRAWKSYTDSGSPLPDALVRVLRSDGRIVAVATEYGMAIAEARLARGATPSASSDPAVETWHVAYFVPKFSGDTLTFDVGTKAQFDSSRVDESRYMFVQRLAKPGHERPMFRAVQRMSPDSLYGAVDGGSQELIGTALADTALLPLILAKFTESMEERVTGAVALARLGSSAPASARDAVRAFFANADTIADGYLRSVVRTAVGRALAITGDSVPTWWARELVRRRLPNATPAAPPASRAPQGRDSLYDPLADAARILAATRDDVGLPLLISAAPVRAGEMTQQAIVEALARYDNPNVWRALVGFARDGLLPRFAVIAVLTPSSVRDVGLTEAVTALMKLTYADGKGSFYGGLAYTAARLRLMHVAPEIVKMMTGDSMESDQYAHCIVSLISLTGRADAPMYSTDRPPASVLDFWNRVVNGPGGLPAPVAPEVGQKLANAWSERFDAIHRRP